MSQARCKKCGRPLTNPISIAMGMGPECAGISPSKRASSAHVRKIARGGVPYSAGTNHSGDVDLFTWVESFRMVEDQPVQPDTKKIGVLKRFPLELVNLVIDEVEAGMIAHRVKEHTRRKGRKKDAPHPRLLLRDIRQVCLELRMMFFPGLSQDGKTLACIPCEGDRWKIGENGREISKNELVAYLSRYGMLKIP
jgi:hypothetical protein